MRLQLQLHSLSLGLVFLLLCFLSFCNAAFEIAGAAHCADCKLNNFKTAHAFSGLHVTIDCKVEKEIKRVGKGELDADGKFKISLPKETIADVKSKNCYAQLHSAAPCPAHGGVEATAIVFKSQIDGKVTFSPKKALTFSTALCTSKLLWPFFQYPPLPKTDPWKKHWPQITIPPLKKHHWKKVWPKITFPHPIVKTLPPPVPIYKPKPKPKLPVVKPLPPSVPIYKPKPKIPVVKPPVPVYKPKPKPKIPVVKPPVPVYKPKPKIPVVKPLPPHVPIYKPPTKPIPHPFHKPPLVKPLPPPFPLFPHPPFYKKPCPPFAKFPPKSYDHPKFGYFPKLPPLNPNP
ncbi:proline-rich protein 4-like [Salvia divinorum]|uniref:Proline-rich protein 4-like n=1 Tax=Salvia divinorum TaxID=28513 RepID=A0ABD1GAM4_SALDI